MKTISLTVSPDDYEAFRRAAATEGRSIAQLIREAMALYRVERIPDRAPLNDLPVLVGHRAVGEMPARHDVYDEIYAHRDLDTPEVAGETDT